jgi:hypothetical protein
METMELREEYKKETNLDAIRERTDGVHCLLIRVPDFDYVDWLECKIVELRKIGCVATMSNVPSSSRQVETLVMLNFIESTKDEYHRK